MNSKTHQDLMDEQSVPREKIERDDWTELTMKDYVGWDENDNNILQLSSK